MASIGQKLPQPEAGWRRYNDTDPNLVYEGSRWKAYSNPSVAFYKGGYTAAITPTEPSAEPHKVKFRFRGSKFRIAAQNYTTRSSNIQVTVDDVVVDSYSLNRVSSNLDVVLCYEKTGLEYGVHTVELLNMDNSKVFLFDALDIDQDGELLPYEEAEKRVLAVLLEKGETAQLSLTERIADNLLFQWVSDNDTVAAVDAQGMVTGVSAGLCYISVSDPDGSYQEKIPVRVIEPVDLDPLLAVHLEVGQERRLAVTEDFADNLSFQWTSDNEAVAVVDPQGIVTAVGKGVCTIRAQKEGEPIENTIPIRVVEP